jgi:hypothetical protein
VFSTIVGVDLVDRFGSINRDVHAPASLCNPASMDGGNPGAVTQPDHLTGYRLGTPRHAPKFVKVVDQQLVNEFGLLTLDVLRPFRLLVPGTQSLTSPPMPGLSSLDHFDCYHIRVTAIAPVADPATVTDQFGTVTVSVKNPTMLCLPTDVAGGAVGTEAHPDFLMCYKVKPVVGSPRFRKVTPVFVANEFGVRTLDAPKAQELCVPTRMNP